VRRLRRQAVFRLAALDVIERPLVAQDVLSVTLTFCSVIRHDLRTLLVVVLRAGLRHWPGLMLLFLLLRRHVNVHVWGAVVTTPPVTTVTGHGPAVVFFVTVGAVSEVAELNVVV